MKHARALLWAASGLAAGVATFWVFHRVAIDGARRPAISADQPSRPATVPLASATPANADPLQALATATREELLAALRTRRAAGATVEELAASLAFLARSRPELALDLAQAIASNATERYQLLAAVVRVWSANDGTAAWQWALQQAQRLDEPGEPPLTSVVLDRLAAQDPQAVVALTGAALAGSAPEGFALHDLARAAVEALLQNRQADLARRAVADWARTPAGAQLDNAPFEMLALDLAKTAPAAAADWLRSLPESEGRNFAFATMAAEWAGTDPQAAANWASSLAPNEGRTDAVQRTFNRWMEQDKVAAAQWLGEHESQPEADRMIATLVTDSTLAHNNPALALDWANLIADPTARLQLTEHVLMGWADRDRPAAMNYVAASSTLTAEQKQQILQSLQLRSTVRPDSD